MNTSKPLQKRFARAHRIKPDSPTSERAGTFMDSELKPGAEVVTVIYHYGMNSKQGHILKTAGGGMEPIVVEICPVQEQPARIERIALCLGAPFRSLPGHRPPDGIAGLLEDGTRVPNHATEMVFNDAELIDSLTCPGKYESLCSPIEKQVLDLARKLYPPKLAIQ